MITLERADRDLTMRWRRRERPSSAAAVPSALVLPGAHTRHAMSAAIGALQSMHTPKLMSHVHMHALC